MIEYEDVPMEDWALDKNFNEIPGTGTKIITAKRCMCSSPFRVRCIGPKGHTGEHWAYDEIASLVLWNNKSDPTMEEFPVVTIPYGCDDWEAPGTRKYYIQYTKYERITGR